MQTVGVRQTAVTAALLLTLMLSPSGVSSSRSPAGTCGSVECVTLAAQIASRMNASADPCQDFYNYACGNFPNVVKYNPLRTTAASMRIEGDVLFEDTMGLMSEGLERNIYELLVLDRVATSRDKDMSDLYNFTRLFYRSCRQWMSQRNPLFRRRSEDEYHSPNFLRGVVSHLNETLLTLSGGGPQVAMETVLAALVKTGGIGILTVSLPGRFATDVLQEDDLNLTRTARARIDLEIGSLHYGSEKDGAFRDELQFLSRWEIGAPMFNFGGRLGNDSKKPAFHKEILEIKRALNANLQFRSAECRRLDVFKLKYTISDLDAISACAAGRGVPFSWRRFFEDLLQAPVDQAALVSLGDIKQVTNFANYVKSRPVHSNSSDGDIVFSNDVTFLVFEWLLSFNSFFPKKLQTMDNNLKPQVVQAIEGDGVGSCMLWTKKLLQPILERMYQTAYHRKDFTDVTELVKLIKDAAISSVRSQSWITPSAKVAIVKKIQTMKQTIGLDELSVAELKTFYASTLEEFRAVYLEPNELDTGFGTMFSLALCAYAHKNFDVMSGLSPVTLFMEISPLVVNAFNWIQRNQIIFPMAILAPPYYHPSYPDYVNLGSLGYVIGHEIGHSFDDIGHTVNQQGAIGHFWDNVTESRYLQRMECVRSRYGGYRLYPGGPLHLSNSTLGNDIADIIGIQAANGALKLLQTRRGRDRRVMPRLPNLQTDFSPEQMLFIQAAQSWCVKTEPYVLSAIFGDMPSHSPHHLRVRGIAENSREFAEAFKCRRGRPMNPEAKCSFW